MEINLKFWNSLSEFNEILYRESGGNRGAYVSGMDYTEPLTTGLQDCEASWVRKKKWK